MKQTLGDVEYEIELVNPNCIRIYIFTNNTVHHFDIQDFTESQLTFLSSYILSLLHASSLEVIEARKKGICRICRKDIHNVNEPVTLNYGKEYAHSSCLEAK